MIAPRCRTRTSALLLALLVLTVLPVTPVSAAPSAPETRSATIEQLELRLGIADGPLAGPAQLSEIIEAPIPFVGMGITGRGEAPQLRVRSLDLDGRWGAWLQVGMLDGADGPDPDSLEAQAAATTSDPQRWTSDAVWLGASTHLQFEVVGDPGTDIDVTVIDTAGLSETWLERTARTLGSLSTVAPAEASDTPGQPQILSRAQWGANESWRSGTPTYRSDIRHAVLHHTVTKNNYTQEETPQQIRNMYYWHTVGNNGWSDIGYNFVVDRFGRIWEGRYGGIDRGVQGAHAANWNTASFGVAIMGNYNDVHPSPESLDAAANLVAWKFGVHDIDPSPAARVQVNGQQIRPVEGHRNVRKSYIEWTSGTSFQYDCPGFNIAWRLPEVREAIHERAQAIGIGPFADVTVSHPFVTQIRWLRDQGIAAGWPDGTFRPTEAVSRQAALAFLHQLAGAPIVATDPGFVDVPATHPFRDAITWAAHEGITQGYPDGTFRPTAPVSRQAAVAFLHRMAGAPDHSISGEVFADVPATHPFAREITWARDRGVVAGWDDGTYRPTQDVTRQAIAVFLYEATYRSLLPE